MHVHVYIPDPGHLAMMQWPVGSRTTAAGFCSLEDLENVRPCENTMKIP